MSEDTAVQSTKLNRRWKAYPEYRASGIEWLREIPAGWHESPLKRHLVSLKDGTHGTFERVRAGVSLLSAKNVAEGGYLRVSDAESLISFEDYEFIHRSGYLQIGDVLLTIVGTIGHAAVFDWPDPVAFQRSVAVLRPDHETSARFFFYLTQADYFQNSLLSRLKQSAQGGVYLSDLGQIAATFPTTAEQHAITDFLDRETSKIDALVAKKERLIELLQEKRIALISHTVTKGLEPNVPMKDSGIESLGQIPADWEVKRLKYSAAINREVLSEETNPNYLIRYVDIGNVTSTGQILNIQEMTCDRAPSRARRRVRDGDTIVSTVRTYLKAIAFMEDPPENLIVSTGFAVLSPRETLLPEFLWRLVQSSQFVDAVVAHSEGVGYPAINPSRLGCLAVWIPTLREQYVIADFLDRETAKIDALVAKVRKAIHKLKEYRTALISAAVTGKIDVREGAL